MPADSARWCGICREWNDHHTDRHPGIEDALLAAAVETSQAREAIRMDDSSQGVWERMVNALREQDRLVNEYLTEQGES